jgi:NAD(P)H-dependent flavin oxidoreductase YrpB (nitropropane dioxygenase family)
MNELVIGNIRAKLPIIQGGMGVAISLSRLAAAVANQGGIGIISAASIGIREPDYRKNFREANKRGLRSEIRKARKATSGVLGVNIMMALTDHEDLIKIAMEERIDLIILGAGLPLKIPAMIRDSGIENGHTRLVVKVSSAKAAKLIFQYWSAKYNMIPDAVVVEGPLAGGHLGFKQEELTGELMPLSTLIRETVHELIPFEHQFNKEIPVIAAGGIYTGEDMYNIMKAGAKGVKIGTRFVATHECDASMDFKTSYIDCRKEDLTIIKSPVGLPGRAINNHFIEQVRLGNMHPFKCTWHCLSSCDFRKAPYCIANALINAADGNLSEGFAFAGANAYRIDKIQHVSEIIDELVSGYHAASKINETALKNQHYTTSVYKAA